MGRAVSMEEPRLRNACDIYERDTIGLLLKTDSLLEDHSISLAYAAKLGNSEMAGKTIARYEIQSEIGRGGMAAVYLAFDPNFRRNVAIKLVSVNLQENLVFRERFEREAHLIATIEHPAIVPVYDFGEQDNQLYLVMRFMPGGALTNKIKEGMQTLGYATQIISHIAPALDAVHTQRIVHRDLKPGNILLDGFGNPAISDFGIAHLTAATTDLTGSAIIGTPSYMSPEQVRGDSNLDGRSDVYALGVILFEMLTGRGPFHATTPLSLALKHLNEPVPLIRTFRPDLPLEVELILNKAMAKDREMRYSSASELALELRALPAKFQETRTPAPIPIRDAQNGELATELDVDDDFQPASQASISPQLHVVPPIPAKPLTPQVKQSSRRIVLIAAIAGLGLFLLILCGSVGIFGSWAGLRLPGLFPEQSPTGLSTLTSTDEIVLFKDDFSDPNSGWPTQEGYSYQQDGYHILVGEIGGAPWAKTSRVFENSSISVDASPVTDGITGYYGLLCRIQDGNNFYYFVTRNDGSYTIGKYKNAEFQSLFSDGWRQSDAINQGKQTNLLKADCAGNTLRFYVNDVMLAEVNDKDFISGFNGILAAALDARGFEVVFNNFLITNPSP